MTRVVTVVCSIIEWGRCFSAEAEWGRVRGVGSLVGVAGLFTISLKCFLQ